MFRCSCHNANDTLGPKNAAPITKRPAPITIICLTMAVALVHSIPNDPYYHHNKDNASLLPEASEPPDPTHNTSNNRQTEMDFSAFYPHIFCCTDPRMVTFWPPIHRPGPHWHQLSYDHKEFYLLSAN